MNIYEKLNAIQTSLKAPKSQYNSFGGYKYRKAEDILEAVKPLLKENGCALICTDELVQIGERYYVKATATLIDLETCGDVSVQAFAREEAEKKGMDGSQVTGASSSYARKYALNGLLCIDDTADSDTTNVGDGTENKTAPKKAAESKKTAAPAPTPAAPEKAPQKSREEQVRDAWVKAIAENRIQPDGSSPRDAYIAKFNPSEAQLDEIDGLVFDYRMDHDTKKN